MMVRDRAHGVATSRWMRRLVVALGIGFVPIPTAHADGLVQSEDFQYLGAFRLPTHNESLQGSSTDLLAWCKGIEAYYPLGDVGGDSDGFPGSLYGVGHAWVTPAFEISIPRPVISESIEDLPVARLIQGPTRVLAGIAADDDELKGIEWLPAQVGMSEPKLHVSFGKHYQYNRRTTHGWINLDLSNPDPAGAWFVGSESQVSDLNTNEYIFAIPEDWAAQHVGGKSLACGRHREGQVASGPSIVAYGPWQSGDPPPASTQLSARPLVLYRDVTLEDGLVDHCWADNWTGGAWLRTDDKAAAVIVGTKGLGECWYGWPDGTTAEECETWPGGCEANGYGGDNRGFCASYFRTVILFYDPADLARVADGSVASYQPQPYRMWNITPYMIQPEETLEVGTGGVAYDEAHGYLYITERYGDRGRNKPIVHVFALGPHTTRPGGPSGSSNAPRREVLASPNPFRDRTLFRIAGEGVPSGGSLAAPLRFSVYDLSGRLVSDLGAATLPTVEWNATKVPPGTYFVRADQGGNFWSAKVSIVR